MFGWMFGMMGFSMAAVALHKVGKLEAELKERRLIGEDFGDEATSTSDPSTWSAEKKARVEAARKKMVAARWKLVLWNAALLFVAGLAALLAIKR